MPKIKVQCSILAKLKSFSLLNEAMYNYNRNQDSTYDLKKLAIFSISRPEANLRSNCGQIFKKGFFRWHCALHWWGKHRGLGRFDCGISFYTEAPKNVGEINRELKNISRSFENPRGITSIDQHYNSIDNEHISNNFLNRYNSWDMDSTDFKSLNRTNNGHSSHNQYPQKTTHQSKTNYYPVFSSLRTMDSKKTGLRGVSFAFFQKR